MNLSRFLPFRHDAEHQLVTRAARAMRLAGVNAEKAKVRAVCDEMRRKAGLPPATWPALEGER